MTIPVRYQGLTLDGFLKVILRAYPGVTDVVTLLSTPGTEETRAFSAYMEKEHWMGMQLQQRGITHYITRSSGIRGTAGYGIFLASIWHKDPSSVAQDNPAIAYRLFCDRWYEWVPVPLV